MSSSRSFSPLQPHDRTSDMLATERLFLLLKEPSGSPVVHIRESTSSVGTEPQSVRSRYLSLSSRVPGSERSMQFKRRTDGRSNDGSTCSNILPTTVRFIPSTSHSPPLPD